MAVSMMMPAICMGVMRSCKIKCAHNTTTGNSMVIRVALAPAPILGIPTAKRAGQI